MGWSKHIASLNAMYEGTCIENAKKHGFTMEQALDECDSEEPLCLDCPFPLFKS